MHAAYIHNNVGEPTSGKKRPFPSGGLNVEQMCSEILGVGLEPEVIPYRKDIHPVSLLYGYLKAGLPAILGIGIKGQGNHAITVAGFSLLNTPIPKRKETQGDDVTPMVGLAH